MKFLNVLSFLVLLFTVNFQYGQEGEAEETLSLDSGTISSQFDFISTKSGNYRADGIRYEVVKESNLYNLRKNVLDSLRAIAIRTTDLKSTIAAHETTIASLNNKLEATTTNLLEVSEEKDSMSILGVQVSKGTYNITLWTIIGGLFLLLGIFIYRFRNSNFLTMEARQNLSELEIEYEDHRRRALEREQKISRQLQDEYNKKKTT